MKKEQLFLLSCLLLTVFGKHGNNMNYVSETNWMPRKTGALTEDSKAQSEKPGSCWG